jgi:DNA-binding transcriptional regulator YbjK
MRQRRAKGVERKQAIVDAAVELIAARGPAPLSHRAAARRAGVPDSAPSYYFESIEELTLEAFRAAIGSFVERIEALREEIGRASLTPEQAIGAYVAGAPGATRETRLQFEAYLYAVKHPEVRGEVQAAIEAMTSAAEGVIRAIGRPDLVWAAPIVVAFVDGFTIQQLVKPGDYQGLEDGLLGLLRGLQPFGGSERA